jgi:hypothetical protein
MAVLAAISVLFALAAVSLRISHERDVGYQVGDRLEIEGLRLSRTAPSVVLWLDTACQACIDSVAFYRQLTSQPGHPKVVIAGREPRTILVAFAEHHRLRADEVLSVGNGRLRFRGTPTVLLVDPTGRIRKLWFGKLNIVTESEVLGSVG